MLRHGFQPKLFDSPTRLPNGLVYRPDFLTPAEEEVLLVYIDNLAMPQVQFGQHESKRRGMSFLAAQAGEYELPRFLLPLQNKIAKWLGVPRGVINEAFIQEYPTGYGIGWHRDRETPRVIGVSLLGWARMRFRRLEDIGNAQKVVSFEVEPRSAYLMQGEVATHWQHSVAPVEAVRYSITFRTLL